MLTSSNVRPNSNYLCFLSSLIFHTLIIVTIIAITAHHKQNYQNLQLNISNLGAVKVNIVNSEKIIKTEINKSIFVNDSNKNSKIVINKANNKQNDKQKTPKVLPKQVYETTGGVSNNGSKVVPVIKNGKDFMNYKTPTYPRVALINHEQGTVIVRLLINENNQIIKGKLYRSSGHDILDKAVLAVVKDWSLKYNINKTAWLQVEVNFLIQ
ncbi:energy transducer TonB [Rickettsiales bacterium LUAb2]